jgi:glutamyl/glutaminyl-tRNA synthetase
VYATAVDRLRADGLTYACDCTRATFAAWRSAHRASWKGAGCPGGCRKRGLAVEDGLGIRVALGEGLEGWEDALQGERSGSVADGGDLLLRDRNGNWTYALCVVVDDLRHGVDLVVRGDDLLGATAPQIRLGRLLGRADPPRFAHHGLIRRPDGSKLSKADGATAIGEMLATGHGRDGLIGDAAVAVGLISEARPLSFAAAVDLVAMGNG